MNIDETLNQLLKIKEELNKLGGVDITNTRVCVDVGVSVKYYRKESSGKRCPKVIWID